MMDELLVQFLLESRELIAGAAVDFATLSGNAQSTASIESAFRAIHTLKGSVALFPMLPAERVLHSAEETLERARKGSVALEADVLAALVGSLDQVDRWIDEIEQSGVLADDAPEIAEKFLALLAAASRERATVAAARSHGTDEWLARLRLREAEWLENLDRQLTAFRYVPDADCFFRGDDPFAVAATVPELLTLAILPRDGAWPDPEAVEPFSCFSILEGLSTASPAIVSDAFRLMPDQVTIETFDQASAPDLKIVPAESNAGDHRTLRVDAARIDALGDVLGELYVAINGIAPLAETASRLDGGLAAGIRAIQANLERVSGNLHSTVSAVRSVSLEPTLRRLPRLAREIAAGLGKRVDFSIAGHGIEIDKQIADGLFEPLLHLTRNAIDHGIETTEERRAAGKTPVGQVSLEFARDGDAVVALFADDGAGIDAEKVRRTAAARGHLAAQVAESLSDPEALRLIFEPGFSTATAVTEISGRGVGMDVVQTAIKRLSGSIEVDSTPGGGTRFRMRLPVSALTTRLLVIESGGERYGVALDQVVETVGIENARLMPVGEGVAFVLRDRTVPVLDLAVLLGCGPTTKPTAKLLVTQSGEDRVALRIDGFAERIDTLVRPHSGLLAAVPGVIGSTLLGDGSVLLVLDLPELAA